MVMANWPGQGQFALTLASELRIGASDGVRTAWPSGMVMWAWKMAGQLCCSQW